MAEVGVRVDRWTVDENACVPVGPPLSLSGPNFASMTPAPAELPMRFPFASGVWDSTNTVPAASPTSVYRIVKVLFPELKSGFPLAAVLPATIELNETNMG